jgi:hypothetical protein
MLLKISKIIGKAMQRNDYYFLFIMFLFLCILPSKVLANDNSLVPVIFIPGYAASSPIHGQISSFIFNRGVHPEELKLSPSYYTLVYALKKAGYKEGKTFFGAVYDWRMTLAPQDGLFDGYLENVTAQSITSNDYTYAVNYFGYWLDQAVQANPELNYIDVVTHSTGGIIARAYIQSPAYGAKYTDRNGIIRQLPKIRYLILGAAPNEGTVHSWRPWNGDFQDVLSGFIPTTELEARATAWAFIEVIKGKKITGPDYTITLDSILQADKNGDLVPDATQFFHLYVPMRQSLMATDDFLLKPGSTVFSNVNDDPSLRSDVLLDLNALSSSGNNPWLSRIGTATGEGGAIATYATGAREKTSVWDFIIPGLINKNPFISTLTHVVQLSNEEGSYLPLLELLKPKPSLVNISKSLFPRIGDNEILQQLAGDGNGAFISYLGNFAGDPKITLVQWGNGTPPADIPPELIWTRKTDFPVYHVVFFFNVDVAAFVVSTLTGKHVLPERLFESSSEKWLKKLGPVLKINAEIPQSSFFRMNLSLSSFLKRNTTTVNHENHELQSKRS